MASLRRSTFSVERSTFSQVEPVLVRHLEVVLFGGALDVLEDEGAAGAGVGADQVVDPLPGPCGGDVLVFGV